MTAFSIFSGVRKESVCWSARVSAGSSVFRYAMMDELVEASGFLARMVVRRCPPVVCWSGMRSDSSCSRSISCASLELRLSEQRTETELSRVVGVMRGSAGAP